MLRYWIKAQCWPEAYLFTVSHWQFNPPSCLLIAYNSISPPNFTIYIIYLTILRSFYYHWALVWNLNWNNVLFVTDCQKLWLSLIGYDQIQIKYFQPKTVPYYFSFGDRYLSVLHARLRNKCSSLNHRRSWHGPPAFF